MKLLHASTGGRSRIVKHVVALALMIIALILAGEFNLRIPAAQWVGPAIIVFLFAYGVWILLWLGPMRNL